jgi:hypothetical protein
VHILEALHSRLSFQLVSRVLSESMAAPQSADRFGKVSR